MPDNTSFVNRRYIALPEHHTHLSSLWHSSTPDNCWVWHTHEAKHHPAFLHFSTNDQWMDGWSNLEQGFHWLPSARHAARCLQLFQWMDVSILNRGFVSAAHSSSDYGAIQFPRTPEYVENAKPSALSSYPESHVFVWLRNARTAPESAISG